MNLNKIAILIPCYNEELTISRVVLDFKKELPDADIYVYDNNSIDKSIVLAKAAGAIIKKETRQGKGYVVQSMFKDIEADFYIMVDADDTYPANKAKYLIEKMIDTGADMVVGDRLTSGGYRKENKRSFHNFGNLLVRNLVNMIFGSNLKDIMSGYRIFSRDFVKNYPVLVGGFQLETDLTIFALDKKFTVLEVPVDYKDRPRGSESKLNTFSDGFKVIKIIFNLFRYYRPFLFFSILSILFFLLGLIIGIPVINEFIETSYVKKIPSSILSVGLMLFGLMFFVCGLILDSIKRMEIEFFNVRLKNNRID